MIELLVVVLIIGILSAVALPQYEKAVHKAKIAEAYPIVRAMQNACDLANLERGTNLDCPLESFDEAVLDIPGNTVEYGGGSPSKQSKNFIYVLVGAGGWPVAYYTKNLEPWGDGLCIYIDDETKELSCGYLKEEDKQICQTLGIPVVEDPGMCW